MEGVEVMVDFSEFTMRALGQTTSTKGSGTRLRFIGGLVVACLLLTACAPALRGRYTWGHEVHTIQLCDSREVYWVRCEQPLAARLRVFVENHTGEPYTPIYIEVNGHMLDEKPDGFAADYDGIFYLKKVLRMTADVPANCPVPKQ